MIPQIIAISVASALFAMRGARRDAIILQLKAPVNHKTNATSNICFAVVASTLAGSAFIYSAMLSLAVQWLVFDLALNCARGLPLDYLPRPKGYTAFTDRALRALPYPEWLQFIPKLGIIFTTIWLILNN